MQFLLRLLANPPKKAENRRQNSTILPSSEGKTKNTTRKLSLFSESTRKRVCVFLRAREIPRRKFQKVYFTLRMRPPSWMFFLIERGFQRAIATCCGRYRRRGLLICNIYANLSSFRPHDVFGTLNNYEENVVFIFRSVEEKWVEKPF